MAESVLRRLPNLYLPIARLVEEHISLRGDHEGEQLPPLAPAPGCEIVVFDLQDGPRNHGAIIGIQRLELAHDRFDLVL